VHALLTHRGDALALLSIAPNLAALPAAEQRREAARIFAGNSFMEILRAETDRDPKRLLSRH
jgi:hypothetical protein